MSTLSKYKLHKNLSSDNRYQSYINPMETSYQKLPESAINQNISCTKELIVLIVFKCLSALIALKGLTVTPKRIF